MLTMLDKYFFVNTALLPAKATAIEVGSWNIDRGQRFIDWRPGGKYIVYEADAVHYQELCARVIEHKLPIVPVHKALAEANTKVKLYRYKVRSSNSLFPRHNTDVKKMLIGYADIEGVTLVTMLDENNITQLNLLTLNCEGAELYALRQIRDNAELVRRIDQIAVSFHDGRIYPLCEKTNLLHTLSAWYDITEAASVPGTIKDPRKVNLVNTYYLLTRKGLIS